jgi:hypothetical protein
VCSVFSVMSIRVIMRRCPASWSLDTATISPMQRVESDKYNGDLETIFIVTYCLLYSELFYLNSLLLF